MVRERVRPRFCFQLPPSGHAVYKLVELAVAAEQAGFDGVWASSCPSAGLLHSQAGATATWPMLAGIGARTSSISLGAGLAHASDARGPPILASSMLALAALYPGRPFLTVAAGLAGSAWLEELFKLARRSTGSSSQQPPIYILGGDDRTAAFAGLRSDGWVADVERLRDATARAAFRRGALSAGKDPDLTSIQVQVPVVVGGASEMEEAAETVHLLGSRYAFRARANVRSGREELAVYDPFRLWLVGDDADVHVRRLRELLASGATGVYIQSVQRNSRRVIDFYGRLVLPSLR